jgi:hypothetical protein
MPLTFDEQIDLLLANLGQLARGRTATWRVMGYFLGERNNWFPLGLGVNKKIAVAVAKKHRHILETEGPFEGDGPMIVAAAKLERWDWGRWREFKEL